MTSQKDTTPPTRARLPTAAEMDEMSGRAFLEMFREANEKERKKGDQMLVYRGELVSGPAALPRLLLRELLYEKVLVGPVTTFDQDVCRLIELPTGGLRIEHWVKNVGWTEAPPGYITLDKFVAGAHRPTSARDAARLDIPRRNWTTLHPSKSSSKNMR